MIKIHNYREVSIPFEEKLANELTFRNGKYTLSYLCMELTMVDQDLPSLALLLGEEMFSCILGSILKVMRMTFDDSLPTSHFLIENKSTILHKDKRAPRYIHAYMDMLEKYRPDSPDMTNIVYAEFVTKMNIGKREQNKVINSTAIKENMPMRKKSGSKTIQKPKPEPEPKQKNSSKEAKDDMSDIWIMPMPDRKK